MGNSAAQRNAAVFAHGSAANKSGAVLDLISERISESIDNPASERLILFKLDDFRSYLHIFNSLGLIATPCPKGYCE